MRRVNARFILLCAALAPIVIFSTQAASAATVHPDVQPGSVTSIFGTTPGSGTFTYHANATGWYTPGSVTVSFELDEGPSSSGPWSYYDNDSRTCKNVSACSTKTYQATCSDAYWRLTSEANGPGGNAENNPSVVIKHIYGSINTIAPASGVHPEIGDCNPGDPIG